MPSPTEESTPTAGHTVTLPVALTIAGSDSGGGAGIQADLKTFEARDVFGTSAITAVTAQNTTGVTASQALDPTTIREQIRAVCADFPVGAIKTGMLANADIVEAVADELSNLSETETCWDGTVLVVDPVMVAESGDPLLTDDAIDVLRDSLIPESTLVTPNADEATLLTDFEVTDESDAAKAGHELVDMGADAALVTGGHLDGDPVDVLITGGPHSDAAASRTVTRFEHDRIDTDATHGSGCTVSAAITAELAKGASLTTAIETATEFVNRAIGFGYDFGDGAGPVHHLAETRTRADIARRCRQVHRAVSDLASPEFAPMIPEVGMNVAAAPRYATSPDEVVAVEGRLHPTSAGVRATGGVVPGASSHVARFLLGIREFDQTVGAACNVRHSPEIGSVVQEHWDVEVIDRTEEPDGVSGTMDWAAREAMRQREGRASSGVVAPEADSTGAPDAVLDHGAVGKEAIVRVLAASPAALVENLRGLRQSLELDADVVEPLVVDGEVDEERRE